MKKILSASVFIFFLVMTTAFTKEPTSRPNKIEQPSVSSMLTIFNRMPKNLLPDAEKGWKELTLPKVSEWITKDANRKPFKSFMGQFTFDSCSVQHIKRDKYLTTVKFNFAPDFKFKFNNQVIWLRIIADNLYDGYLNYRGRNDTKEYLWYSTQKYYTNQRQSEEWQKKPINKRFDVKGRVMSALLRPVEQLEDCDYILLISFRIGTVSEHKTNKKNTKKPKPTTKPINKSSNKARSQIKLAKMYLSASLELKAIKILYSVIRDNPDTSYAKEAKKILAKLK